MPISGPIFIFHILQKGPLVMGSIGCFVIRMNCRSLVPTPTRSQIVERIENQCRNQQRTRCWIHFSIYFGQYLPSSRYGKEQLFLQLGLHHRHISPNAIHTSNHVVVSCAEVFQCYCMVHRHPQGPLSE
jgi:hypothetical protein